MNPNKLKNRTKFIEGKPLRNRAQVKTMSRRDMSKISPETMVDPEDKFETFFDYEEELSGMKSSAEQFQTMIEDDISMEMEEIEESSPDEYQEDLEDTEEYEPSFLIMEEADPIILEDEEEKIANNSGNNKGSFVFIQCEFIKGDGNRCKKQAPKGSTICSVHKKFLKRNKNESV